jgi:hypothetical protein
VVYIYIATETGGQMRAVVYYSVRLLKSEEPTSPCTNITTIIFPQKKAKPRTRRVCSTIMEFTWRDEGKPRKPLAIILGNFDETRNWYFQKSVTATPTARTYWVII